MTTVQHTRWAASLAADIAFAEQILTTRGELCPLFIIEAGGVKSYVECKFPQGDEKRRLFRLIQLLAIAGDAVSITAITQDSDTALAAAIVYRESGRVHATQAAHAIERNEQGQVTGLGPYNGDGDVPLESHLMCFLPSARPGPEQRAHAKATFDDLPWLVRRTYAPKPLMTHPNLSNPRNVGSRSKADAAIHAKTCRS
jgi:hypothetical protein